MTTTMIILKKSKRRQVIEAKRRLDHVGAKLLGVVMNKVDLYKDTYYYYY